MGEQYSGRAKVIESVLYTSLLLYPYAYPTLLVMEISKETTGLLTFPWSLIFLLLVWFFFFKPKSLRGSKE